MPTLDPATIAAKWATNLSNSVNSIRAGVQAVTTSPTQLAAAAVTTWQARLADPATATKYTRGLQRVTLNDWQQAMLNKGIPRISSGAQAATPKFQKFLTAFLPFEMNVAQQVRSMPKATLQDRINRAVAQIQGNAQFVMP